jgi:hypothetical protein
MSRGGSPIRRHRLAVMTYLLATGSASFSVTGIDAAISALKRVSLVRALFRVYKSASFLTIVHTHSR